MNIANLPKSKIHTINEFLKGGKKAIFCQETLDQLLILDVNDKLGLKKALPVIRGYIEDFRSKGTEEKYRLFLETSEYHSVIEMLYLDQNYSPLAIKLSHVAEPKEIEVSVSWSMPETLIEDEDLSEDGELGFNDNLFVTVNVDGETYETHRRFLIVMGEGGVINCTPEPDWNWNEHGELTEDQADMIERLEEDGTLEAPQEFLNNLYEKFYKK